MRRSTLDLTPAGWGIALAVLFLVVVGMASIYVTDTHYALGHDGPRNAAKQLLFLVIGVAAAVGVMRIGYQELARFSYLIFLGALLLLVPLLAAKLLNSSFGGLTAPRNGAYRWIHLPGYQLQPSELMKVAFVVALAWYLRYRRNFRKLSGLLVPFAVSAVPLILILLEPDLGTALLLLPVLFVMLFAAGARLHHLTCIALIGTAALPLVWGRIEPYQRLRVTAVLLQIDELRQAVIDSPEDYTRLASRRQALEWAASSGYQLVQSKNAIGSGGLLGQGWGQGIYATSSMLPDRHNDFVFAVIAHQWGLLGSLLVLIALAAIAILGVRIASGTTEPFARLLAVGVVTLLTTQALINIGMALGMLPITGMTLPFVSYGGSSLLTNCIAVGLLISVAQYRPFLFTVSPPEFTRVQTELLPAGRYESTPVTMGAVLTRQR